MPMSVNSKRSIAVRRLGIPQSLELHHPTQKRLHHTESNRECRAAITALLSLTLFLGLPDSSSKLFVVVALVVVVKIVLHCYRNYNLWGKMLLSLDVFGPIACCMVSALEFLLCHLLFLHIRHDLGSMTMT